MKTLLTLIILGLCFNVNAQKYQPAPKDQRTAGDYIMMSRTNAISGLSIALVGNALAYGVIANESATFASIVAVGSSATGLVLFYLSAINMGKAGKLMRDGKLAVHAAPTGLQLTYRFN